MLGILTIYRGEDTSSFGNTLFCVKVPEKFEKSVAKIQVDIANITKYYDSPVFPCNVSFSADETLNIRHPNVYPVLVTLYDRMGRSRVFDTGIKVQVKDRKYIGFNSY